VSRPENVETGVAWISLRVMIACDDDMNNVIKVFAVLSVWMYMLARGSLRGANNT